MILLANVRDVKNLDCEVWYIVRSLGNLKLDEMHKHVPELSPNSRLFFRYLNVKKMGAWNRGWFDTNYVPAFIRQMKHDENAQAKLQELVSRSETEDIALVCFCNDEALCHRSIVGGILMNLGAKCDEHIRDYNHYKL